MTFIAGYIYKNTMHMVADSAETMIGSPGVSLHVSDDKHHSSFIEHPVTGWKNNRNFQIKEGAQKIYIIDNNLIASFAGDVRIGVDVIEGLKYVSFQKPANLSKAVMDYFLNSKTIGAEFIVGFYIDSKAYILRYAGPHDHVLTSGDSTLFFTIGNVGQKDGRGNNLVSALGSILYSVNKYDLSQHEVLTFAIAALQDHNLSVHNLNVGVGGYFNGVILGKDGPEWAKDTMYLMYSSVTANYGRWEIFKFNKDNTTFLITAFDDQLHHYAYSNDNNTDAIVQRWGQSVHDSAFEFKVQFFIFRSIDRSTLIIINNDESKKHRIVIEKNGDEIRMKPNQFVTERILTPNNYFTNFKD